MSTESTAPAEWLAALPADRRQIMEEIRSSINKSLPKGFEEVVSSGMLSWVVPYALYPPGYHCRPKQPLPFLSLASQKSHIALYHMGLYSSPELLEWFRSEWPTHSKKKLDMGKSCVKFKKPEDVTVELIGELASKMTPQEWIGTYEAFRPRDR